MVRNIVIVLILAVIGVPAWQIGRIMLEKKQVSYLLQEQANKIKKYDEELVKSHLKEELKNRNLPTEFTFEVLEPRRKLKISYNYSNTASLFGHTYWQTAEQFEAVTEY